MNERIRELWSEAAESNGGDSWEEQTAFMSKFAELIVRECCLALWTEECHTSNLAFDEVRRNATRIKEHFGIDPNKITEDMLTRSITWMEQQLADKKHFGVEE
jgi:hypothetical protein